MSETHAATRFLTIPADLEDVPDLRMSGGGDALKAISFAVFFRSLVLIHVPWGTADQQDALEALARLERAAAGDVVELRERDHATLVQAMAASRAHLPGQVMLALMPFYAAVARAPTASPKA